MLHKFFSFSHLIVIFSFQLHFAINYTTYSYIFQLFFNSCTAFYRLLKMGGRSFKSLRSVAFGKWYLFILTIFRILRKAKNRRKIKKTPKVGVTNLHSIGVFWLRGWDLKGPPRSHSRLPSPRCTRLAILLAYPLPPPEVVEGKSKLSFETKENSHHAVTVSFYGS